MFEFIKSLFKRKSAITAEPTGPILVHTDINESIVITEVALADVKPKARKLKAATLKEVEPIAIAKGVKPKAPKAKSTKTKPEPAKIVQLVPPVSTKKKGRPKKDTTV
jgi:hypothetical protein